MFLTRSYSKIVLNSKTGNAFLTSKCQIAFLFPLFACDVLSPPAWQLTAVTVVCIFAEHAIECVHVVITMNYDICHMYRM